VYVRNIRALLHNWEKDDEDKAEQDFHNKFYSTIDKKPKLRNVLIGRINFIKQVRGDNDEIFIKFWNKYHSLIKKPEKIKQIVKEDDSILALIAEGESYKLEFKQSMEYSQDKNKCITSIKYKDAKNKDKFSPKFKIIRAINSFLNSEIGVTLLIGVENSGKIYGLSEDLKKCQKNDPDKLALKLTEWVEYYIKPIPLGKIQTKFYKIKNNFILKVDIRPYHEPAFFEINGKKHIYQE